MIATPNQVSGSGKSPKKIKPSVVAPTISTYWNGAICPAPIRRAARATKTCPKAARTEQQQQRPLDPLRHGHCQIGNAGKGADGQDGCQGDSAEYTDIELHTDRVGDTSAPRQFPGQKHREGKQEGRHNWQRSVPKTAQLGPTTRREPARPTRTALIRCQPIGSPRKTMTRP